MIDCPQLSEIQELTRSAFKPHHVGVAVRSIEKALDYYIHALGFRQSSPPVEVPSQGVRVCFIEAASGFNIELVEGVGPDSPVERVLTQTGGGPYHLCFEVLDLDAAVKHLRGAGFFRLKRFAAVVPPVGDAGPDSRTPRTQQFAFMLTPDRQLIELCQAHGDAA